MAQNRAVSDEGGGHEAAVLRDKRVSHRVDAAMDRMEPAARDPVVDGVPTESERSQLQALTTPCCRAASAATAASDPETRRLPPITGSTSGIRATRSMVAIHPCRRTTNE